MDFKKLWPYAAMSMVAVTTLLSADRQGKYEKKQMHCDRIGPCGPEMGMGVNPSARPFTDDACCCDAGEFSITVAGFYWQATEDGLEYAVNDSVITPTLGAAGAPTNTAAIANIIDASFRSPEFKWKPGFKIGAGYNTTHDGWDLELTYTHFNGRASSSDDNESDLSQTLLPLWSDFAPISTGDTVPGTILFATQGNTSWRLDLNLVDLELGREFWTSKMLSIRPHIGLRYAMIHQRYKLEYLGGSWDGGVTPFTDEVTMKNQFDGGGVRGGLDTNWMFGCCDPCSGNWGFFGNVAFSLIYGKFRVEQEEETQSSLTTTGFATTPVLETDDNFRSIRGIVDLAVGLQWNTLYRDGTYGLNLAIAWEFHHFFNQNQFWRVMRIGDTVNGTATAIATHGENVFAQTRGDLSTQGVTFTAKFTF